MTQDELKKAVAHAALDYVVEGKIVGVGTGSTARLFIDALAGMKDRIVGAVGVIGPTRLNYSRIVPMVDYTTQLMARLSRGTR